MTDWAATATASTAISPWASRRDELVRRTVSIAADTQQRRLDLALPSELTDRIDRAERRAEALAQAAGESDEARRAAALEFLAETVTALVLDRGVEPGGARELVGAAAAALEIAEEAAALTVFMRALASADVAQLPPHLAVEMLLELVVELGPADAVSLFTLDGPSGQLECAASSGEAPRSRRMRAAGRAVLEAAAGLGDDDSHIRAIAVTRWDKPFAALVARCGPGATREVGAYLAETGSALSPLFEREMLFERNAARERTLVSASERRLVRLACDLHDGPLQELVAFAADLRHAREQVGSLLDASDGARVRGRFDDLEARLGSLDQGLREISHAVRGNTAVEQPLEHVLRREIDVLVRTTGISAELAVDGDVSMLTASQRIALFRVVQEALANIRKHSGATQVSVRLRSAPAYVSVSVSDNGCGFDVAHARSTGRLGLAGLGERVRMLGGDVEIASGPGEGAEVRVTLPQWRPVDDQETPVYAVIA